MVYCAKAELKWRDASKDTKGANLPLTLTIPKGQPQLHCYEIEQTNVYVFPAWKKKVSLGIDDTESKH